MPPAAGTTIKSTRPSYPRLYATNRPSGDGRGVVIVGIIAYAAGVNCGSHRPGSRLQCRSRAHLGSLPVVAQVINL